MVKYLSICGASFLIKISLAESDKKNVAAMYSDNILTMMCVFGAIDVALVTSSWI